MVQPCSRNNWRLSQGMVLVLSFALLMIITGPSSVSAQVAPPNDLCVDAFGINCSQNPFGTPGTNVLATATGSPFCGTSPGINAVWYSVMGNGFDIQVDTCSINTNFDTKINVYTGNCGDQGNMVCVGGNDDAAGSPPECELGSSGTFKLSRVGWTSVVGVEYLIAVSGFSGSTGDFELTLDCEVPVELQRFTIE